MTKDEAMRSLKSASPHERLRAARLLSRICDPSDLGAIRTARAGETDAYVKSALEGVISRLSASPDLRDAEHNTDDNVPADVLRLARTQAMESVTALLLHEVSSPFGLVANAAAREVPGYPNSNTKRHIDRVQRIFDGIEQLRSATATPKRQDFDLVDFIARIVAEECAGAIPPTTHGPRPFIVTTDPHLLRFAFSNGLRNAIEATEQVKSQQAVVITWGRTDVDNWVAIIDQGPGLPDSIDPAFEPGKSTKGKGHSGFGLAIAKQAMDTLGGMVTLSPARAGGARYELRWEH